MRTRRSLLTLLFAAIFTVPVRAQLCGTSFTLQPITGITQGVVAIDRPPADQHRLFFMTINGVIRITNDGTLLPVPALTLSGLGSSGAGYGMAFDPNFATTGHVYFFIPTGSTSSIVRYSVSAADPNIFDPLSRQVIFTLPLAPTQHTGGWIGFGPDNLLYVGLGDNGPSNDVQNLTKFNGKLLRIDPRTDNSPADLLNNYAVPENNPFVSTSGARPEIFALGLRNPWRCAFDLPTGRLFISDVGAASREEIDLIPANSPGGMNFGWPICEGTNNQALSGTCSNLTNYQPPLFDVSHSTLACITGGYVYRGSALPALNGRYIFGSCSFGGGQRIYSINPASPAASWLFHASTTPSIICFGSDAAGEPYAGTTSGALRIVPTALGPDCNQNFIADSCDISSGRETDFNANAIPDSCERLCLADFNASLLVSPDDIIDFLRAWFQGRLAADVNHSGLVSIDDVFSFLAAWFTSCE